MKKKCIFWLLAAMLFAAGCSKDEPTPPPPPPPPPPSEVDLSEQGTANCYMVPGPGDYVFDATVMGNGVSTERAAASRLAPVSVTLLWQDTPDLFSELELRDGCVRFTVGVKQGNALLAVCDSGGKVLWSWHIWVTDYDPVSGAVKLNGIEWMTRNLGARFGDYDAEGTAKGMVYQWGRKDPFPSITGWTDQGSVTVYDASGAPVEPFVTEQVAVADNLQNAITHPTTYYFGTRNDGDFGPYDWMTTDASAVNSLLWETAADAGKTLFDPCPPGWRVPRKESWTGLNETNFIWDEAAYGRRHALLGYYPAAGGRGAATGEWSFVGGSCQIWSSSVVEDYYVSTLYFLPGFIDTQNKANRSSGFPVRCVTETPGGPVVPPTYDEFTLDRVTEASYTGAAGDDASSNYYIGLANVPFQVSDTGEQVPMEPGMIMYLDLYGQASPNQAEATLPEGTYTVQSDKTSGSANSDYTWARIRTEQGEITYRRTTGGKVKVKHIDAGYRIEGSFRSSDGADFTILYEGALTFTDRTPTLTVKVIEQPVNAVFSEATATWEYSNDKADRYTIHLLDGRMEAGELVEGYRMTIDLLCPPLSSKEKMEIAPGVYRIGTDYVTPMTFTPGSLFTMLGLPFYYGTYCQQAQPETGSILYGFAVEGTVEVKRSGESYEFSVDVTTPEGVSIKGTYAMAEPEFIDNAPWTPAGPWLSILRDDKTIVFSESDASECRVWRYDDYYEGATEFEIMADSNTANETFQLDILAPEGATSIAGIYTAAADPDNPVAGEFVPGYKEFSILRSTWGYLLYNTGVGEYVGAPAKTGTIEITELEDGKVQIQFEVQDDAIPANSIRSTWSGSLRWID